MKWRLYLLWPCFLRRTAKLPEMTAIPIVVIFLEEESEITWNDTYTNYGHVSWGGQRNYLKWQLPIMAIILETTAITIMAMFFRRTAKLHNMTAIPILAIYLDKDSETTWNDSYTYYGHVSWGRQRNYLKWQLYFSYGNISWAGQQNYLKSQL